MNDPVRVLLADEHALFRGALRSVLDANRDLEVVAEAKDGNQAVQLAACTEPDVVLLDAALPNLDGVSAAHLILGRVECCAVVIVTEREDLLQLASAVRAGVKGYLSKKCSLEELIEVVRAAHHGKHASPRICWAACCPCSSIRKPNRARSSLRSTD